jgi:acetylornithine/succinyldiaminopimelate/putrescine aminotransferase
MAAAVINEPIITDTSVHRLEWLKELREQCTWAQTLLIFDEVITGGRYLEHSVSKAHGISPDLICLGKALGGGLPLAIVGGPKAIMERDYFVSSTFAGETLALAAGLQVFKMLAGKYDIKRLWAEGERFQKTFNSFWPEGLTIEGYPTRGVFKGEPLTKALFMQECIKSGILIGPSFFFNFPHMEVADEALSTFMDILLRIRAGNVKLEGEMPVTPFAETVRTQ